jgi:hypothetical protein
MAYRKYLKEVDKYINFKYKLKYHEAEPIRVYYHFEIIYFS